jgi:hypothetical protein
MQSYRIADGKLVETWITMRPLGTSWTNVAQERWTSAKKEGATDDGPFMAIRLLARSGQLMQRSKFDSYLGYTDRDGSLLNKAAPDPSRSPLPRSENCRAH